MNKNEEMQESLDKEKSSLSEMWLREKDCVERPGRNEGGQCTPNGLDMMWW